MPFLFPIFGVFAIVWLVVLAFDVWMLVDAVRRPETDFNPPQSRVWWIVGLALGIVVWWIGLVASIAYFLLVRRPVSEGKPATQLFGGSGGPSAGAAPPRTGRFCQNCGEPLGTHARFCQHCGTPADLEDR